MIRPFLRPAARPVLAAAFLVTSLLTTAASAQSDTQELSAAVVRSLAPAADDPDAVALDLLAAAAAHHRSPVAVFVVEEAWRQLNSLQRPAAVRDAVRALLARQEVRGLVRTRLAEFGWLLDRAVDGPVPLGPGQEPYPEHATALLAVGPFGDAGDHFAGVPFAPELHFPALGAELPGRGTTAKVRVAERRRDYRRIGLADPARDLPGCYYALQRVTTAAPTPAFLEVECEGDHEVFVDGRRVLLVEPWREPGPSRHYVPLQLPAGAHEVLVKTCSGDKHAVALRWTDPNGATNTAVTPLPPEAPAPAPGAAATVEGPQFATALDALLRAARAADATPAVRIAAMRCARILGADFDALAIAALLRETPPTEPEPQLAWAAVVATLDLPDEQRAAEARAIEEKAIEALPKEHHRARIAAARLLEQQDQRESALRELAGHAPHGPETWALRLALVQHLHFTAEEQPLLREWAAACPNDPRPWAQLADAQIAAGQLDAALVGLRTAHRVRPDQTRPLQRAFEMLLGLGRLDEAAALVDVLAPLPVDRPPTLARLRLQALLARVRGDRATLVPLLHQVAEHPETSAEDLERITGRFEDLGDRPAAVAALQTSLTRDPDEPHRMAWLAALGGAPEPGASFAAFRRDGEAARKAFQAGPREETATSTLVIDQRIVELREDGSWISEIHELRRINDLSGVEEFQKASAPAHADEVLLLRTIGTDGRDYVPPKVDGDYSLQRLEPGAFVEMRYREHGGAPGAHALQTDPFLFQSADCPTALCELVVVTPTKHRGELRTRRLGPPTRSETLPDGRSVQVFTRTDVPRLAQERHTPNHEELVPVAALGEDDLPFALLREVRVQLLRRTIVTPALQAVANELCAGLTDDRAKLARIWAWCQKEIESGPAESAGYSVLRKKGNRTLVAVGLLRAAGIEVLPTACRDERPDLGGGDDALFTSSSDHSMPGALVVLPNGEPVHLFLDAPRHWPLGEVPAARAGTTAYLVRADAAEPTTLPASRSAPQALQVRGKAEISGDNVKLEVEVELGDVAGFGIAEQLREQKEDVRKLAARQIAQQLFPGWRVQSAQAVIDTPGEPFRLRLRAQRACVQADGERFLVPLPLPPDKLLARLGDRAERTLPLRLPVHTVADWELTLDPGQDRALDEIPAPTEVRIGGLVHSLTFGRAAEGLVIRRHFQLVPTSLPAERFGEWLRALSEADRSDQTTLRLVARQR